MGRLSKKIAFVTGAGGGIGRAICQRFLAEGARVVAVDINADQAAGAVEEAIHDGRALALCCDVGDSEAVRTAIAQAVSAFGGLHIICNVAGGSTSQDGSVTEAPDSEFWRAIRLDLFGTFACCKHGIPELIKSGGGSIINMASMVALMAVPGKICYTAAKGGVLAITREMAVEYAPHSIRVNAISPGITRTPRVQAFLDNSSDTNRFVERHVLGLVEPLDVAHMAVYLASDESRIITGQNFSVDSGATIS